MPNPLSPLACWLVALPLQLWGATTGPTIANVAGIALFVVGVVLFTAWAAAGGVPPMHRGGGR